MQTDSLANKQLDHVLIITRSCVCGWMWRDLVYMFIVVLLLYTIQITNAKWYRMIDYTQIYVASN